MHRLRILHIKMNYVWMNKQRYWIRGMYTKVAITGKSLSEALLFAEHGENMLCTKIVLNVRNNFCTRHVLPRFELGIFMYCVLFMSYSTLDKVSKLVPNLEYLFSFNFQLKNAATKFCSLGHLLLLRCLNSKEIKLQSSIRVICIIFVLIFFSWKLKT